jgi:16S rRNA (cytidine1402-2'-O)-methyltransferase
MKLDLKLFIFNQFFETMTGKLYLIPTFLGETEPDAVLPPHLQTLVNQLNTFIVEEVKTARRVLRKMKFTKDFNEVTFYELNEHTKTGDCVHYLNQALQGGEIGLLSEAGMPCIADPGNVIVKMAHEKNIRVIPLVGPSSILLALISSGFNGQQFTFNGYIPIKQPERNKKIQQMEKELQNTNFTQIFMDTPYRNLSLFNDIIKNCKPDTLLCIAASITCADEYIQTLSIKDWKNQQPDINKKPAIFLIGKDGLIDKINGNFS